jgi:hypothetical protein
LTCNVADLGRDIAVELPRGTWVELVNDLIELRRRDTKELVPTLLKVVAVDDVEGSVTVEVPDGAAVDTATTGHPLLRRWDQPGSDTPAASFKAWLTGKNAVSIAKASAQGTDGWITLEDGVQVKFSSADDAGTFLAGDAWRFAARYATGDVEWPLEAGKPKALPPHEPLRSFAPLKLYPAAGAVVDYRVISGP